MKKKQVVVCWTHFHLAFIQGSSFNVVNFSIETKLVCKKKSSLYDKLLEYKHCICYINLWLNSSKLKKKRNSWSQSTIQQSMHVPIYLLQSLLDLFFARLFLPFRIIELIFIVVNFWWDISIASELLNSLGVTSDIIYKK